MNDDPAEIQRRIAHLMKVRGVARTPQTIGSACCLVGVALLMWASYKVPGGAFSSFGYTALAVIAAGWVLFVYSVIARKRYLRANPYDSKA